MESPGPTFRAGNQQPSQGGQRSALSTAAVGRHIIDDDIGVDGHTRSLAAGDHVLELGSRPSALRLAVRLVAAASANAREASTVENNNNPNKLLINETHFLSAPQVPSASAQIGEACRIPIVISGAGGSLRCAVEWLGAAKMGPSIRR